MDTDGCLWVKYLSSSDGEQVTDTLNWTKATDVSKATHFLIQTHVPITVRLYNGYVYSASPNKSGSGITS